MIRFTEQHEWVRVEGDTATIGITPYAAEQLGDVVYVELPEAGKALTQFKEAAVVESVKAASEVYAPVSGEVIEANTALGDEPAKVNEDPLAAGWFIRIRLKDPAELDKLMSEADYQAYIKGL
ncbi:MAG: glycine cleavage system protein GcvH [Alphaproteobacteria bacterium]|nr:glycine cleavage system protein GcvH [Alphaproteobacteria bacterium]